MRLFPIVMIACAFFVSAGVAHADGSLKDGPMPEPSGRCIGGAFAGPYAGVQVGFGSTRSHQDVLHQSAPTDTLSDNDKGFTIGGHAGYNVQCGRVLYGVETDFNYFGTDTESDIAVCGSSPCGGPIGSASFRSSIDWFGTLRGRVGLVGDENYLIYATGGLAYANVDHRFETTDGPFSQSNGDTQFGWTIGGGVEFMRDENWSLRAEALYVDLGSDEQTYRLTTACGGSCTQRVGWDDNFWIARVGLTYHFHRPESDYTPLK